MISKIKNKINSFIKQQDILTESNYKIVSELHDAKILFSKLLINDIQKRGLVTNLQETEFKVFSQFGDDDIIQYLIHNVERFCCTNNFLEKTFLVYLSGI